MINQNYFKNPWNAISKEDSHWCSSYCKTHWEEETAHIFRVAEDAVRHEFLFDLRWDMERTYEPVCFGGEIQWDYMPGDDPEFIFQFNRHAFFVCLGQAYSMTGDERYAAAFVEMMTDWAEKNPLTKEGQATIWRTIEAGIRAENWVKAMSHFSRSAAVTDEVMKQFILCLKTHGDYLVEGYGEFQIKSNWGVIESRGLLEIGLALSQVDFFESGFEFDSCKAASWAGAVKGFVSTAINRLTEEIQIQVLDDGVHWEQSPMYHNEVFHCYIEALRLADRYELSLPAVIKKRFRDMAYANLAWKKPNHCQITKGDSDETDIRDLLGHSALLLNDPRLKYGAYERLDFDGVWDYLREGAEKYQSMEGLRPDWTSKELRESGNYYLRSDWGEKGDLFHFSGGCLGGGHGHSDKLHIDLVINGEDVLMDCGRYTYVAGERRTWYKSAWGHNVPLVDNEDYFVCDGAWSVKNMTQAYYQPAVSKGQYTLLTASHGGYLQGAEKGVLINRKVVAIGTRTYLVMDEFYTEGTHTCSQLFHFNNRGEVSANGNTVSYLGKQARVKVMALGKDCGLVLKKGTLSRNYNQQEDAPMVVVSKETEGFCSMVTVITALEEGSDSYAAFIPVTAPAAGRTLTPDQGEAIEIVTARKRYVVIFNHQDIGGSLDMLCADGCRGLGKIVVFDADVEKTGGTVLA